MKSELQIMFEKEYYGALPVTNNDVCVSMTHHPVWKNNEFKIQL